jgi:hypothetical protein
MANDLTGDFDICFEVSEGALTTIATRALAGAVDLDLAIGTGDAAVGGRARLNWTRATIVPIRAGAFVSDNSRFRIGDDLVRFTVGFESSALSLDPPAGGEASPVAGYVRFDEVYLSYLDLDPAARFAGGGLIDRTGLIGLYLADLPRPYVHWTRGADLVAALMERVGLALNDASEALGDATELHIATTQPRLELGPPLTTALSREGSLHTSPPTFAWMDWVTLPAAAGRPGVLSILANVLADSLDGSRPAGKRRAATRSPHLGSVTISPRGFRELYFCRMLPQALGLAPRGQPVSRAEARRLLPPPCGRAAGVELLEEVTLEQIGMTFREGRIVVSGRITSNAAGWTATAAFTASVTLDLIDGGLVPEISLDDLRIGAGVDWWVAFRGGLAAGPFGAAIEAAVTDVLRASLRSAVADLLESVRQSLERPPPDPGTLGALIPQAVEIHPEGIVFQGGLPLPAARPVSLPAAWIAVSERTLGWTDGPPETAHGILCTRGSYEFNERHTLREYTLQARTEGMTEPVSFAWRIGGADIESVGGMLEFTETGVALTYQVGPGGSPMTLTNGIDSGNFSVEVECTATDAHRVRVSTSTRLTVRGSERVYRQAYHDDLRRCIDGYLDELGRGPREGPLPPRSPARLAARVRAVLARRGGGDSFPPTRRVERELAAVVRSAGASLPWLGQTAADLAAPLRRLRARATEPMPDV